MKTIGNLIREYRIKKHYSFVKLEEETKIKKEFIQAVEKQDWSVLPEYPVVVGFVKNIANALNLDSKEAVAFLRRDYPPKSLRINPKPDLSNKLLWTPKKTFILSVCLIALFVITYLVIQYINFIKPPFLQVDSPKEGSSVSQSTIWVQGKTDPESTILVNNQPVIVDDKGYFSTQIEIFQGTKDIIVIAKSRSGKETLLKRNIKPELNQ